MLLRIEDIDTTRARPEFETAIFEDLAWLGLTWETPVLRQSERLEAYAAALAKLDALGLVYPAVMSRGDIQAHVATAETAGASWPRDPDGAPLYPGEERDWPAAQRAQMVAGGRPHALRLDMRRALAGVPPPTWREASVAGGMGSGEAVADPAAWGDVILARRDSPASYHLAVVLDDAFQGVTDVVRGADLRAATGVHRLLQTLLGLAAPRYHHHRLIVDRTGAKLSKSRDSESLRALRAAGLTAAELTAGLA